MSKPIRKSILLILCVVFIFSACVQHTVDEVLTVPETEPEEPLPAPPTVEVETLSSVTYEQLETGPPAEVEMESEKQFLDEDIALIALVTMAEAEGECEEGKRLVIATILNRVDSEYFPDTIYEVIYQPHQFSSMWNGRVDRCEVREDIYQLVREEMEARSNHDVIFFTAGDYSKYGVPMFQVENHYFSSYD